jgi:hypothetical protein
MKVMVKKVGCVFGLVVAFLLAQPAASVGAAELPPVPTGVTVSWEDNAPLPGGGTGRAVRVSWQETGTQPNRVCQNGNLSGYCVSTTGAEGDTVLMQADQFAESASTRVGVQVLGTPDSDFAYSAAFDTQLLAAPAITNADPWVDGRLLLRWTPGPAVVDTTPNDPLDLAIPPQYQRTSFDGNLMWPVGPLLTGSSAVISAPDGGLVWIAAVNEWGYNSPTFPGSAHENVWDTDVHATIPTTTEYGQTTAVTGGVTSDYWECYGHPPSCGSRLGSPAYKLTPSPGRRVVLEARNAPTSAWYTVGSTLSATNGSFRLAVRSPGTRQYRVLVLGVSKAPASDARAAAVTTPVRTTAVNRVASARFDDPYVSVGDRVTARVSMALRSQVRSTLQRWSGSAWVNVKWVYLTQGTGVYTFTATTRGVVGWRFVIPASTSPEGLPVAGTLSGPFYYKAS